MIGTAKVISTSLDKAKRLVVKILFRGKLVDGNGDVKTPIEVSPFGIDSNPIEGKVALYVKSTVDGKYYVAGYLNTQRKAQAGEVRLFSTDGDGAEQGYHWLKNDGTQEFNGDDDNLVRFLPAKSGVDDIVSKLNEFIGAFNGHIHGTTTPGAPTATPTPVPSTIPVSPSTATIDDSKIDELKTTGA
jgi:hypothetical protein